MIKGSMTRLQIIIGVLKGKFSSGIEGTLGINIKSRFQLETTVRNYSLYFSFDVFKVYLSNIDSETGEILSKKRLWILGVGVALYYDLKYKR